MRRRRRVGPPAGAARRTREGEGRRKNTTAESRAILDELLALARERAPFIEVGDGCAVFLPDGTAAVLEMRATGPVVFPVTDEQAVLYVMPAEGAA